MASRIVRESSRGYGEARFLEFVSIEDPDCGFTFDCDKDGNPILDLEVKRESFTIASDPTKYRNLGVRVDRWTYRIPAVLRCYCGREVELSGFTNTCDCGRDFNQSGQELAPREQWGSDTGESLADILSIQ